MSQDIIRISDSFWNIRGSFRIGLVIDIGTQASLVRLRNGNFVFLDSYRLPSRVKRQVMEVSDGGARVEAIINLHPFHTVHCKAMHRDFPDAKLFGTKRHAEKLPGLPWESVCTEDPDLHERYAADLEFSIPRGVDFISDDEHVHFSSVLAYHPASRTIHVDDTLVYVRLPALLRFFGISNRFSFHPTLSKVLEKRTGAAADFHEWASGLADAWSDAENLCAAHTGALLAEDPGGDSISSRITSALDDVSQKLKAHEKKYSSKD